MNSSARPRLSAQARTVTGKKLGALRRQGILPAVVYGHGHASESIQLDAHEFDVLRRRAVHNTLLDLSIDGKKDLPVLLQDVDVHPVTRRPRHVDLFMVTMTEEMTLDVPISIIGESDAIARQGGTLLHLRDSVLVRGLPGDLPATLDLDISSLHDFETQLHVSDLIVPSKVTVLTDPSEAVARIQASRAEVVATPETVAPAAETAEAATES